MPSEARGLPLIDPYMAFSAGISPHSQMDHLHKPPPSTIVQLLQSLALSHTPLHYLSLALLTSPTPGTGSLAARNPPPEAMQAIQHLSLASGLVNLLSQLPAFARSNRLPALPVDIRVAHSVTPAEVARLGGGATGVKDAVFEVATRANDELVTSRAEWGSGKEGRPPKELLPAFLPGVGPVFSITVLSNLFVEALIGFLFLAPQVAVQSYLSRLEKASFDPFTPVLQHRHWKTPLDVWWAVKRGRY